MTTVIPSNQFVGKFGEMLTCKVRVKRVVDLTTMSPSFLNIMEDEFGNTIIYFSPYVRLRKYDEYVISGVVKDYNEREGVKQTVLDKMFYEHV